MPSPDFGGQPNSRCGGDLPNYKLRPRWRRLPAAFRCGFAGLFWDKTSQGNAILVWESRNPIESI